MYVSIIIIYSISLNNSNSNTAFKRGTAPSAELLATWNKREKELIDAHPNSVPPVAFPPEPVGAYVGQDIPKEVMDKVGKEGARTVPGREHGGNCDVSLCLEQLKGHPDYYHYPSLDQEPVSWFPLLLPCLCQGCSPFCRRLAFLTRGCEYCLLHIRLLLLTFIVTIQGELSFCGAIEMVCPFMQRTLRCFQNQIMHLLGWYHHFQHEHHQRRRGEIRPQATYLSRECSSLFSLSKLYRLIHIQPSPIDPLYSAKVRNTALVR